MDSVTTWVRPLLKPATTSSVSVAPTERANRSLPGEPPVPSPSLPMAATTGTPRRKQSTIARVYVPGVSGPITRAPRDMLMTSTLRSRAQSIPASTWASLPPTAPSSTNATARRASGATPIHLPLALPPAMVPHTCVPWRSLSWGVEPVTRLPAASNSAQFTTLPLRSGCSASTPVSSTATFTPLPRTP